MFEYMGPIDRLRAELQGTCPRIAIDGEVGSEQPETFDFLSYDAHLAGFGRVGPRDRGTNIEILFIRME